MLKTDLPPSYEESRNHPYGNPHGNYPQPPGYGFPAYGIPPQPPVPYPVQPGMQPPPAVRHCPAFHCPGVPPIIPTYGPSGVPRSSPSTGDAEGFASPGAWDSRAIRHAFIQKVYLILAAQLIVTVAIVAVFTFVDPVRSFVVQNPAVYWASFAIYFVTYIVLVCCEKPRRVFPWNLILLCVFTLAMSYMTGTISSYYDTKAVFLALLITAVVCVIVTVFCFQTKVDFTSCTGLFCVLAMVFLVIGIVTAIVLSFQYVPWLHMLYAAIGAIVYTLFLAYHTQLLMGNRAYALSPEEYIYGALALYVDIVQIFMFLVQITGASSE
ncbi:protein lifeguard 3 isoform X1 [Denticeps clupeoides]|uniref:protein lifeguard 3 isoform X1 n=1 Tax=Denticeps clupeoides TaxID=299321 RepID=UPI0010A3196E|nr:protein lifeguard 3-like isoform X1 [Denticeps clupeoides]XP_028847298.1 protein lifeguard 3-like isoform X1 [Denticeps clupeoides]